MAPTQPSQELWRRGENTLPPGSPHEAVPHPHAHTRVRAPHSHMRAHARTSPQSTPAHARRARTASASPPLLPALLRHFPALAPRRQPALPGPSLPLATHGPLARPPHGSVHTPQSPPEGAQRWDGRTAPWGGGGGGRLSRPCSPRNTAALSWGWTQPSVGPGVVGRLPRVRRSTQIQRGPGGIRV